MLGFAPLATWPLADVPVQFSSTAVSTPPVRSLSLMVTHAGTLARTVGHTGTVERTVTHRGTIEAQT